MSEPYTLTPADVMALRCSVRWRVTDACGDIGAPYILWLQAEAAYSLHAYGATQAICPRLEPLAACLRGERAEAGFIRRILDPAEPCTLAVLDPEALEAERRVLAGWRASEAQRAIEAEERHRRYSRLRATVPTPVETLSLDDLLS